MRPVGFQGEEAGSAPHGRLGGSGFAEAVPAPAALGARGRLITPKGELNAQGGLFPAGWWDGALGMLGT